MPTDVTVTIFLVSPLYLFLIGVEGSCYTWLQSMTHIHSVGLLCTSDQPNAETST